MCFGLYLVGRTGHPLTSDSQSSKNETRPWFLDRLDWKGTYDYNSWNATEKNQKSHNEPTAYRTPSTTATGPFVQTKATNCEWQQPATTSFILRIIIIILSFIVFDDMGCQKSCLDCG